MSAATIYLELNGQPTDIPPGSTTIGRSRTCGVRLDDLAVSRNHAMLSRDGERVTVKDLESSNGTFLNGARLGTEVELTDGDVVAIGETEIVFRRLPAASAVAPPDLSTRYVPRPTSSEAIAIGDVLPVGEVLAQPPAAWEKTNHGPAVRPRPVAVPAPPPGPAFAQPTRPQPVAPPAPPPGVAPFPAAGPERPSTGELLPSIDDIERQLAAQEAAGPASDLVARAGGRLAPAGFLRRFFALVIDGLLIVVIEVAVLFALGGPGDVTASLAAGVAGLACSVLLFTIGWWKFGATPGKKLLGLVVCDSSGAVGLPLGRAFVRWLGYLVSAIPLGAGYLVALFEPQKRALHDLMAGSYVARRR